MSSTQREEKRFHFNFVNANNPPARSASVSSSPSIPFKFRPTITSAMPAITDDDGLDTITLGDDDVLEEDEATKKFARKSRFIMRLWSWVQSKYKMSRHRGGKSRRQSVEYHAKRLLSARASESGSQRDFVIMNQWQRAHSADTLTKSWAEVCVGSALPKDPSRRRSLMPPTSSAAVNKERFRTGSLVAPNMQPSMLQPPIGPQRESSMESGYLSHESNPNSPRSFLNGHRRRPITSQSQSEDDGTGSPPLLARCSSSAREKRSQFHAHKNVFHEVIEDSEVECENNGFLNGEWGVNHEELHFGQKLVDGRSHRVYAGKWHGDVVIHAFTFAKCDKKSAEAYYDKVKALMQIRHENIVSFMGASAFDQGDDLKTYAIVTNPIRAESLHAKSAELGGMFVAKKMSIACQVANALGYLHAKGIVHGRLCSRNVFLEPKVQLSLLDYAVGLPNFVYSSPQLLEHPESPINAADDVFAFGTLIFEIFMGHLPFHGSDAVARREIKAGHIQRQLHTELACTEKLKRVIQSCWALRPEHRAGISQLANNFQPGSCLVRRHSTSEPRLDQWNNKRSMY